MLNVLWKSFKMKRANNLLPFITDIENLRLAYWKAAKGKRHSKSVLSYQENLGNHLLELQQQIQLGHVDVGQYRYFLVYEPKEREICASHFREQVLHHALMNVCHAHFDKKLISDSYASRKGKGTYAALNKASRFSCRNPWYLKLDVRKFFASIHHDILKTQLAAMFKEKRLLSIFYQIIDSYEASPNRGLPIGNLTSQYFANHYLSGLDHFIKEKLGIKAYVRYMDDMVLWHKDKNTLKQSEVAIANFVENCLAMELKPCLLNQSSHGLPFLGYKLFPYHIRLLQKSKQRFIKKSRLILQDWHQMQLTSGKATERFLPLLAFIQHADSKTLQKNVLLQLQGQTP